MRVLVAHIYHESNTFCLEDTPVQAFEIIEGEAMLPLLPGVDVLREAGFSVVPSLYAQKWSSGTVSEEAMLCFAEKLTEKIRFEINNIDGIFLSLHGGMTVRNLGSGQEYLLRCVREIVGSSMPIAVSLDMHANIPSDFGAMVNVLTGYHTAPHIDAAETQRKAAAGLVKLLQTKEKPHPQVVRLPMLLVGERALTKDEPFRTIIEKCEELERQDKILAATMFVGMAWSDTPNTTASISVTPSKVEYTEYALAEANKLAQILFECRDECPYAHPSFLPQEAVERALESINHPLYLSDSGDNPTAGGVGDSTLLLRIIAEKDTCKRILFAPIFDKRAYGKLILRKQGDDISIDIGSERESYCQQITLHGNIAKCAPIYAWHGTTFEKVAAGVLFKSGNIDVVVTDAQMAFTGMECFESLGLRVEDYDVVVLKMGYMFAEISEPCKENIMALTPGCTPLLITADQYHHLPRPIWPLDEVDRIR